MGLGKWVLLVGCAHSLFYFISESSAAVMYGRSLPCLMQPSHASCTLLRLKYPSKSLSSFPCPNNSRMVSWSISINTATIDARSYWYMACGYFFCWYISLNLSALSKSLSITSVSLNNPFPPRLLYLLFVCFAFFLCMYDYCKNFINILCYCNYYVFRSM